MKTLPLPDIVARLTAVNNCSDRFAQAFMQEFAELIAQAISETGSLNIKGLGTFQRIEVGDEVTVEFAPDKILAQTVNAPFAMFEPIELDENITAEMLNEAGNATTIATTNETNETNNENDDTTNNETNDEVPEPEIAGHTDLEPEPEEAELEDKEPESTPPPIPPFATTATEPQQQLPPPPPIVHEKIVEKEHIVETENKTGRRLNTLFTAIIALIAGVLIGYFAYEQLNLRHVKSVNISADDVHVIHQTAAPIAAADSTSNTVDTAESATTDSASVTAPDATATAAAQPAVTDVVKGNRFLTTIAQEHYGKKKFWVYIYEENRDKISDPNHIAENTVVVVPPAEKYGIKAGDAASEADAERRAVEILNKQ